MNKRIVHDALILTAFTQINFQVLLEKGDVSVS